MNVYSCPVCAQPLADPGAANVGREYTCPKCANPLRFSGHGYDRLPESAHDVMIRARLAEQDRWIHQIYWGIAGLVFLAVLYFSGCLNGP